jgi:hypothetical protein
MISIKELIEKLNTSEQKALEIMGLITKMKSYRSYKSVQEILIKPKYEPDDRNATYFILLAINQIIEGYGVETIEGKQWDNFYGNIIAEYINMDDTI